MPDKLYTTGEAAKLLGVHKSAVLKWCNRGMITAHRTSPKGHWRISKSSVEEYAKQNGIPLQPNSNTD